MKRNCLSVLIVFAVSALLAVSPGCANAGSNGARQHDKITIGLAMATLKEERWYIDRDAFVAEAQKLGANVYVDVAYDNAAEQLNQVRTMLDQGIDVLVIIPHDANNAAQAVAMAKRAGVKVISYDRLVLNANVDLYITFDNVKVGVLQAEAVMKAVPQGNYVIVEGPATDYNSIMIDQGISQVLEPFIKTGSINVVKKFSTKDWMADEAADGINKLLQDSARIDAVIAENDSLAGGVINTLSEYHLLRRVPVVGMDADLAACQRVVEGQQLMTVYKPIRQLAVTAADFALKLAKGEDIGVSGKLNDGKYDVPYYAITPEAVFKTNMVDAVINDGFHRMSEVYMNIAQADWPK